MVAEVPGRLLGDPRAVTTQSLWRAIEFVTMIYQQV